MTQNKCMQSFCISYWTFYYFIFWLNMSKVPAKRVLSASIYYRYYILGQKNVYTVRLKICRLLGYFVRFLCDLHSVQCATDRQKKCKTTTALKLWSSLSGWQKNISTHAVEETSGIIQCTAHVWLYAQRDVLCEPEAGDCEYKQHFVVYAATAEHSWYYFTILKELTTL